MSRAVFEFLALLSCECKVVSLSKTFTRRSRTISAVVAAVWRRCTVGFSPGGGRGVFPLDFFKTLTGWIAQCRQDVFSGMESRRRAMVYAAASFPTQTAVAVLLATFLQLFVSPPFCCEAYKVPIPKADPLAASPLGSFSASEEIRRQNLLLLWSLEADDAGHPNKDSENGSLSKTDFELQRLRRTHGALVDALKGGESEGPPLSSGSGFDSPRVLCLRSALGVEITALPLGRPFKLFEHKEPLYDHVLIISNSKKGEAQSCGRLGPCEGQQSPRSFWSLHRLGVFFVRRSSTASLRASLKKELLQWFDGGGGVSSQGAALALSADFADSARPPPFYSPASTSRNLVLMLGPEAHSSVLSLAADIFTAKAVFPAGEEGVLAKALDFFHNAERVDRQSEASASPGSLFYTRSLVSALPHVVQPLQEGEAVGAVAERPRQARHAQVGVCMHECMHECMHARRRSVALRGRRNSLRFSNRRSSLSSRRSQSRASKSSWTSSLRIFRAASQRLRVSSTPNSPEKKAFRERRE